MLIRLEIENYLSFNESTEFNTLTGEFRRHANHVEKTNNLDILKLSTIYGANATGKSNLIKSLEFIQDCILDPFIRDIDKQVFKGDNKDETTFEIEFISHEKSYIYGLKIIDNLIDNEYLYLSNVGKTDKQIFERTTDSKGKSTIVVPNKYINSNESKTLKIHYEGKIEPDQTFMNLMNDLEIGELSNEIGNAFSWFNHLQIVFPDSKPNFLLRRLVYDEEFLKFSQDLLCSFDTGIKKLHIATYDVDRYFGEDEKHIAEDLAKDLVKDDVSSVRLRMDLIAIREEDKNVIKKLFIEHHGFLEGNLVSLFEESDGTIRLIEFMSMLYDLLIVPNRETVYVIDEIGRSLHPTLLKAFITKLSKEQEIKGQLIFSTHESHLLSLDIFRPDEIWFAEKDNKKGHTTLKTLSEYKNIRPDVNIKNGYFDDRFGGIPMLANLDDLKWTEYGTEEE